MEKKKNKIIDIVIILLVTLFTINLIALGVQKVIAPNETPNLFGYKAFLIVSGSMENEININDLVLIKKVDENEIQINDIISFKKEDVIITHRVIDIQKDENGILIYTTKGDNNNIEDDEKVYFSEIEGKYQFKISKVGTIVNNRIVLFCIFALIVILYFVGNNKKMS